MNCCFFNRFFIVPGLPFVPSVLVGCKCDLKDKIIEKITKEAKDLAMKEFFVYGNSNEEKLKQMPILFETSSKENIGIPEVFER